MIKTHTNDNMVQCYLDQKEEQMTKITLKANNEKELLDLTKSLEKNKIAFKLWIELPENIPTCIAIKPDRKSVLKNLFREFKLFD